MSSNELRLMTVFAHPDDEAFGTGGTLAKYAAEGCKVYLVTATRGEAGQIADPTLATPSNLPFVREQELRCACQIYGIEPPLFLDYVDGQLPIVHQGQAVGKLVRLIRLLRPQVLITFGPDGIYGHYDHIAAHRWATIAAKLAADPGCFPEQSATGCAPHQVSKVYYRVMTDEEMAAFAETGQPAEVMMDGVPFPFVSYPREQVTTMIDARDQLDTKLRGIECHRTQIGRDNPLRNPPENATQPDIMRYETFILAHSTVGWPQGEEDDLFARLR